jgi:hypothetical protein
MPIRVEMKQGNSVLFVPGALISDELMVVKSKLKKIDDMSIDQYNKLVENRDQKFEINKKDTAEE